MLVRRTAASASSRPAALRERSLNPIACARFPAARDRSRSFVRIAPPAARTRLPVTAIRRIALANRPESVGYDTLLGTTVVSARSLVVRSTLASVALAKRVSFRPCTAAEPQRVVSFINVVGSGIFASSGIRQNRRQVIESPTSRHRLS